MGKFKQNLIDLIGNTPLVRINQISELTGAECIGKLEASNPGGSVKDRIALNMIEVAEQKGELKPGNIIIEPTSGNTGIGLAWIGAAKGYKVILTMPETMSLERRKLLSLFGAKIVLTDAIKGMRGAIEKAEELVKKTKNAFMPRQFDNPANPDIHRKTTAEEIWKDTEGKIDVFVAGVGTGGTLTGVGKALKQKNPDIKIIAVEPESSAVLSGGKPGSHMIQGIGAGFIPKVLNREIIDEIVCVKNEDALQMTRELAQKEGLLVGISSGSNVWATKFIAKRPENKGKQIVTMLCDTGERYLSISKLFD